MNDRFRKSNDQVKLLEQEFEKNPNWTKAQMKSLAQKLNLKLGQIYKWNWDRKMSLEKYFMRSPFATENKNSLFKVFKPQ